MAESNCSKAPCALVEVIIDNIVYGEGIGTSKKEAEQEAAKDALSKLMK